MTDTQKSSEARSTRPGRGYLASEESVYVTGAELAIDGGTSA